MVNTRDYVNFLCEHKLTQSQLLFLIIVKEKQFDLFHKFKLNFNTALISEPLVNDLINKGFLIKTETGYNLTNKFLNIYVDGDIATEEIFNIYPAFITSKDGVKIPLITMDRKIFKDIYLNKIKGVINEHLEILKDIEYAKNNNLITFGINKFLTSEMWRTFRKLRIPDNSTGITNNTIFDEDF